MYITFVAYWVVGFPISIYLGLYTDLKAAGIWIGLLVGLSFAAFLYLRFSRLTKNLLLEICKIMLLALLLLIRLLVFQG
jgi:MATE family multidrug resistance protein